MQAIVDRSPCRRLGSPVVAVVGHGMSGSAGMPRTSASRPWLSCMFAPQILSDRVRLFQSVSRWIFDHNLSRSVGFGPDSVPILQPAC